MHVTQKKKKKKQKMAAEITFHDLNYDIIKLRTRSQQKIIICDDKHFGAFSQAW